MRIRCALLSCLLLAIPFSAARADETSRIAKAKEMFQLAHIDQITTQAMQQVFDQLRGGMMQQVMGVQLTSQQQKVFDDFSMKVQALITDTMGWKALEPDYAKLYASTYTDEELDGILAFYKSPAGQAMVAKSPQLVQAASTFSQERMKAITPQLRQLMQQYMSDITAASKSSNTTSGDTVNH